MAQVEDFLTELFAPVSRTAPVRETAGPEDAGAAVIREAKADLRTRYRLTETQAQYVVDRAVPSIWERWEETVTREARAYIETLPEPLGPVGAVRFWDSLVDARGGR
jgi:hypothetical protein